MQDIRQCIAGFLVLVTGLGLTACQDSASTLPNDTIGGSVTGLSEGGTLTLDLNAAEPVTVSANGGFTFAVSLAPGSTYSVTVASQPAGETCVVANGSGQLAGGTSVLSTPNPARGNVTNVAITCSSSGVPFTIGGAVTGLNAGDSLVLLDNGGDAATVTANGNFTFATALAGGSSYAVTIGTQPVGQNCAITNGSGTLAAANVTNVAVACSDNTFNVGVAVSGLLSSQSIALQDNGGDTLTVTANGTTNFNTPVASGSTYAVTILTQPAGESCTISAGSGTIVAANVVVPVVCTAVVISSFTIGGSLAGLAGTVVLQNNGGDNLSLTANGGFVFATPMVSGATYAVSVLTQPSGENCAVANASGTVGSANVTNVSVTCTSTSTVSTGAFVWEGGIDANNGAGTYGTQGTPAPGNIPPARSGAASWKDAAGNVWVFGGTGVSTSSSTQLLGDLWMYSPTTGEWTWVTGPATTNQVAVYGTLGVAAAGNMPGTRQPAAWWTDASGNFWLFGGLACASVTAGLCNSAAYNDLWKYTPTSGLWTWVGGSNTAYPNGVYGTQGQPASGNVPGARSATTGWVDSSGNFWLLGGNAEDANGNFGRLNDLWKYSPTSNLWTWIGGSTTYNGAVYAVRGTNGQAAAGNWPGGIEAAAGATDAAGHFWLFGGYESIVSAGTDYAGLVNDVWEYSPGSGLWTCWTSGTGLPNQGGSYGTEGTGTATTFPAGRDMSASWMDGSGNLWVYGGTGQVDTFGDLWEFSPSTGIWTWVAGLSTQSPAPTWGTLGVPAASNEPGSRETPVVWQDASGDFWLFGGLGGADGQFASYYFNDLWKITP